MLFDKTGTLTKGQHVVTDIAVVPDHEVRDADELLRLAAAVESDSEHPLARAVVRAAQQRGGVGVATDFRALTGRGVEASVDGERIAVGGPALLRERSLPEPESLRPAIEEWTRRGASVLYVERAAKVVGALALARFFGDDDALNTGAVFFYEG